MSQPMQRLQVPTSFGERGFLIEPSHPPAAASYPGRALDDSARGELPVSFPPNANSFVKEDDGGIRGHESLNLTKFVAGDGPFFHGLHIGRL